MSYIGKIPTIGNFQVCDAIATVNAQAAYTMQVGSVNVSPESANHMIVSLNGVIQKPTDAYTVSGSTITFAANLVTNDVIDFIQILGNVLDLGVPSDATVSTAKIVDGAVTSAKLTYPLTTFSSTGIDDNATSTAMTIDSSEKITLGGATALGHLNLVGLSRPSGNAAYVSLESASNAQSGLNWYQSASSPYRYFLDIFGTATAESASLGGSEMRFLTTPVNSATATERMRIDSSGNVLVGKTSQNNSTAGVELQPSGLILATRADAPMLLNRISSDGIIVYLQQAGTTEGTISVSGNTVSYNGFTGTHWSRFTDNSTPTILRGTVLETLDEMCDWYNLEFDIITTTQDEDGNDVETVRTKKIGHVLLDSQSVGDTVTYNYEGTDYQATITKETDIKHMMSKVSDNSDAKNVYGVFVAYDLDGEGYNDFYVASVGSYVVRIKQGETIAKGDLLQSNGDGTAKVQSDDNIKSSSFAKVLSTTVIETYEDGSYLVPCSLMC